VTEKEFLAVVHAINKFGYYITRYQVFVHTNHSAIHFLMNKQVTNGRITWWLLLLHEFNITVLKKPGTDNVLVDFLSRMSVSSERMTIEDYFRDEYIFSISIHSPCYL